jgi:hypothetical protein
MSAGVWIAGMAGLGAAASAARTPKPLGHAT